MEYKIVEHVLISSLTDKVNELLREGWELYGNPFKNGAEIAQAMIRKDKAPPHQEMWNYT